MVEVEITEKVQGETMLCGLLHKATEMMGGPGESLYYHLLPTVKALETTAAGKLVLASTAIRAGIPQMIGRASEAVAPYSNPVVDSVAGAGKYVVGKGLKGVAKIVAGDASISEIAQEGLYGVGKSIYDNTVGYAVEAMNSAMGKGAESATQAYENITASLANVQNTTANVMSQGVKVGEEYSTKGVGSVLNMIESNVNYLAEMGDSFKDQAYTKANEGIAMIQENVASFMKHGSENITNGIDSGIGMIQENSAILKDKAIEMAKENQTAIAVVVGAAALAAVGYLSYAAYNEYVAGNDHTLEDEHKSMAAKVSKEFTQLKNSRIKTMNAEKIVIEDKFKELQDSLKDTNDLSMIRASQNLVYKYGKDQTIDPEDIKKIQKMALDKVKGANLSEDKLKKLQETSAELMASVMMCDQITKDLSRGTVSPSFVNKVVADRSGVSQRSRSE